ncbi:MAG: glycine--tRNA ligase, partial [Planctomycetota bacterium]
KPSKNVGQHSDCDLTDARQFNLMFKTQVGPVEDTAAISYLRPETAQGIFTNFLNVMQSMRMKLPFGIAQIGKAFRNEIVTGNFIFRTREFEQMEMEYFCRPEESSEKHRYWIDQRMAWYRSIGISDDQLRVRPHDDKELAHYAAGCVDVEYQYPWGWDELEGIANRTDYDVKKHAEATGKKFQWQDPQTNEWITPHVIEPASGLTRIVLVALLDAYEEEKLESGDTRVVMRFHPRIAPVTCAIFPLVKKDGMPEKARTIVDRYLDEFPVFYDIAGAIGRRYRRQDEVGTPFCATVDGQTMEDDTITVRERDSMEQTRVKIEELGNFIRERSR